MDFLATCRCRRASYTN